MDVSAKDTKNIDMYTGHQQVTYMYLYAELNR